MVYSYNSNVMEFTDIRGFIFDNDGVIVNSEPLSCGALARLFEEEFDTDIGKDFSKVIGTSDKYAMTYYMKKHNIEEPKDLSNLIDRKSEIYFEIASNELDTFPNFHELLQYLSGRYELAIASSGNHDKIKFSIQQVGASEYFPIICSATEVERGKPAPDLFEFTAECMGIPEKFIAVVEDSVKGIQGAKAAGMKAIGFTSSFSKKELLNAGADLVIEQYSELLEIIKDKN